VADQKVSSGCNRDEFVPDRRNAQLRILDDVEPGEPEDASPRRSKAQVAVGVGLLVEQCGAISTPVGLDDEVGREQVVDSADPVDLVAESTWARGTGRRYFLISSRNRASSSLAGAT
jgi:hypothetical protein